jgi:hypothetical protein
MASAALVGGSEADVLAEAAQPGMSISYVARRHRSSSSLVFSWRRLMTEGGKEAVRADMRSSPGLRFASCRSVSASSSGCWGRRPWRTRCCPKH